MTPVTLFIIRLGILLVFAHGFGFVFEKVFNLPRVLGEMGSGMLLGYHLLGQFHLLEGQALFTPEVMEGNLFQFFILVATILLLFNAGMHTNLQFFIRFFFKGSLIGAVGVLVSFFTASYLTMLFVEGIDTLFHPTAFFMGIATSTSVGVATRILAEKGKIHSLEGNISVTSAVLDDVLGIVFLAIAVSIAKFSSNGGISFTTIMVQLGEKIGIWLGLTVLGVVGARILARYLRILTPYTTLAMTALGFVLLMGGLSESLGLSMVIGAYILGLGFSTIDTSIEIQERINEIASFFVPVFFAITGIMIDFSAMKTGMLFSVVYALVTLVVKGMTCGATAGILGFNMKGMMRIGSIMLPRGEVTLIIANVGITMGVLSPDLFGTLAFTVFLSTLLTPFLLSLTFKSSKSGYRKKIASQKSVVSFTLSPLTTMTQTYLFNNILEVFRRSHFFVYVLDVQDQTYQFRKKNVGVTMRMVNNGIFFSTQQENLQMVKFLIIEELAGMQDEISQLKEHSLSQKNEDTIEKNFMKGIIEKD